ncbi:MAG: LLM class flavin-dependent oxidoreductase [Actinobacteria bacterium]|nr:MAG: LLM class flavin-dependent oxidoreductase [Actinomycetota bacterium]
MEVGLALPQFDFSVPGERPLRFDTVLSYARRAEALGFESVWLADHLFLGIEKYGGRGQYDAFDPVAALGALARATARVRLGTLVLCAQLRPPALLAKALATIDVLSNGRLIAGMGAGWYAPEYEAAGIPFEKLGTRLEQLVEAIQILRGMFAGTPFTFEGQHYATVSARGLPRPVHEPPIWVGGAGDRLIEVAARHADGWNAAWTFTPTAYAERLKVLDAACERAGREPGSVARSLGLYALVGEDRADLGRRWERMQRLSPAGVAERDLDEWRKGHLVGTVDEVRDQVAGWAALGVSTLIVGAGALSFAVVSPDDVDLLAEACRLER